MKNGCLHVADFRSEERYTNSIPKTLIHVVERCPPEQERILKAVESWNKLYDNGGMFPVHITNPRRTAKLIGDTRNLPFLKDLLLSGIRVSEDDSVIVFTNSDITLHPETPLAISKHLQSSDCLSSFRISLASIPKNGSPEYWNSLGQPDFGRDLFAFKRKWLLNHWSDIPDFVIGEQEWDLVIACMIRLHNKVPLKEKTDLAVFHEESELPLGYVLHQRHVGSWLSTRNRLAPAKLYNITLANQWYAAHDLSHFKLDL